MAAVQAGYGFSAHGGGRGSAHQWFHYKIGTQCISLKVCAHRIDRRIEHKFVPDLEWIKQCSAAVSGL